MVRALAYNIIFIASVSTVLFNANPLLRYDGYYMLADYLEMPNLRARAHTYISYLCERYLFGCQDAVAEPALPLERFWLTLYPIVAFIYRMFVLAAIALFLAGKFFFIGVLLALAGLPVGHSCRWSKWSLTCALVRVFTPCGAAPYSPAC